jgi:hypothetical protein
MRRRYPFPVPLPARGERDGGKGQTLKLTHDDELLGEITSRADAEALRESIRGKEYLHGVVSNALDFALSGDDRHLAYLSPRDRKLAAELAAEIARTF